MSETSSNHLSACSSSECFGCKNFGDKIGILVSNLGTPDAPNPKALRKYLKQFLSDKRVIEVNRALWWVILNGIVLPTRPKRSARLYRRIWTKEGSPLLTITRDQTERVRDLLAESNPAIQVRFGMRYGSPSIESALDELRAAGCSKILLFPMYPQYAAATTGSSYDAVFTHLMKERWVPTLRVAEPYYTRHEYIDALAATINEAYSKFDRKPERLVLSYHGIPEKQVDSGDPYCCMCTETTRALLPKLSIPASEVIHTYQSRFGRDPWLVPYTDETLKELAGSGIHNIALACPGFTADCLETIDELGNEGRELFHHLGGKQYEVIPCLNTHPKWVAGMTSLITEEIETWTRRSERITPQSRLRCPVQLAKTGVIPGLKEKREESSAVTPAAVISQQGTNGVQ